jgi:arylsulfatase A-like enzyme
MRQLLPLFLASFFLFRTAPTNVLVVLSDDQDAVSARRPDVMPNLLSLWGSSGVTFTNAFANNPLCCPDRATLQTGQLAQNHGVWLNIPPGGYAALDYRDTLGVWAQQAGYQTGWIGKFMNNYGIDDHPGIPATNKCREVPPGYSHWWVVLGPVLYNNYTVNSNSALVRYGTGSLPPGCGAPDQTTPNVYLTDEIAAQAEAFIASHSGPWMLVVAPIAPHREEGGPPIPAPRHLGTFATEPFPTAASYNEQNVTDKPQFIKSLPKFTQTQTRAHRTHFRARLEALLAVDELVARLEQALVSSGQHANTVRIYTSDNGWLNGEHRWFNKEVLYEESIRVPLVVSGPGYVPGVRAELVSTPDVTATILALTGAVPTRVQDGVDLAPLLTGQSPTWRTALLLNSRDRTSYDGVRTLTFTYGEHLTGEQELYDLTLDPFQLASKHNDPAYADVKADLAAKLSLLRDCAGASCWQ